MSFLKSTPKVVAVMGSPMLVGPHSCQQVVSILQYDMFFRRFLLHSSLQPDVVQRGAVGVQGRGEDLGRDHVTTGKRSHLGAAPRQQALSK